MISLHNIFGFLFILLSASFIINQQYFILLSAKINWHQVLILFINP